MSGGHYLNYDDVPICSLANFILDNYKSIICFFEDNGTYYKIDDFRNWLEYEYGHCIPAPAISALFELEGGDDLAVLRQCIKGLISIATRNYDQCITVKAVVNSEDLHELRRFEKSRKTTYHNDRLRKPLSNSTIDGFQRGKEALVRIFMEKTGQMTPSPPPEHRRPSPLPPYVDSRQQRLQRVIQQVDQLPGDHAPTFYHEHNRSQTKKHHDQANFRDNSRNCWSDGRQSTDSRAPRCSSDFDHPPRDRYEISGQQSRARSRCERLPSRQAAPEYSREYNGRQVRRTDSPRRNERFPSRLNAPDGPRHYDGEHVHRERSSREYGRSPSRQAAPEYSREYNGRQVQRTDSPRRHERSPPPVYNSRDRSGEYDREHIHRERFSRVYGRSPSRHTAPEYSRQHNRGQGQKSEPPRRHERSPPPVYKSRDRPGQDDREQVHRRGSNGSYERSPAYNARDRPGHYDGDSSRRPSTSEYSEGPNYLRPFFDRRSQERYNEQPGRYESSSSRRNSPIRQNRYEDQGSSPSRGQQRMPSDRFHSSPRRKSPVCHNHNVPEDNSYSERRVPPPTGEPTQMSDVKDEDASFDSMDSSFFDALNRTLVFKEHKTSTPKSMASILTMKPPGLSPVIRTPLLPMDIARPPPTQATHLTSENLQNIDRISAQIATHNEEKRSSPSSVGTEAPTSNSTSAPFIRRISLCPPPGLEAQFGWKVPEEGQQKENGMTELLTDERPRSSSPDDDTTSSFSDDQQFVEKWTEGLAKLNPRLHDAFLPREKPMTGSLFEIDGIWFSSDRIVGECILCLQLVYANHEQFECECRALYHEKCLADRFLRFKNCYACRSRIWEKQPSYSQLNLSNKH